MVQRALLAIPNNHYDLFALFVSPSIPTTYHLEQGGQQAQTFALICPRHRLSIATAGPQPDNTMRRKSLQTQQEISAGNSGYILKKILSPLIRNQAIFLGINPNLQILQLVKKRLIGINSLFVTNCFY
ncbi:hypothetical protein [Candidatus Endoriftia persephone]|jgi:hypothetical protein|uniref:Uncharacterized protein n=1 Tax=Candidatus Endoriftia persephonae TaxID=393765 RepID=A0A9J6ZWW1_9GAMM|nr:hypothetical protein [Candidatus Endoriftia persephone]USF87324.1 hypothetical protein L0Y14_14505 [Candidatus Endoriftia persephone]